MVEKEILLAGDSNKEVLSSELVERLMGMFRGKFHDELGDLRKFTHFVIQPDEKVRTGIDRLNGIIQKLIQRGNPPKLANKRGVGYTFFESIVVNYIIAS